MSRLAQFRIAVRRFPPFETAIRAQWQAFDAEARTGLVLDLIPLDLHDLEDALFASGGMRSGAWDVAFVNTDWIAAMDALGAAVDLAPRLAADPPPGYPEAWSPSLLRLQRLGLAVLGVPYHDGPECLILRRDLFADPSCKERHQREFGRALEPPGTWTDFHRLARFFHSPAQGRSGTVFAGFPDGHNTVYDFLLHLWTRGGELIQPDGSVRFQTSAAADAITFYRTLVADSTATHPDSAQLDSVAAGNLFAAGKVAMMVNWFGFAAFAHTDESSAVRGRVDIAPVPAGAGESGRSASLNVYWLLALASGSPHRELAWRFLRHTQTPAMDLLTSTSGAIGCRLSTWENPVLNQAVPFYSRLGALHEAAREIPARADWPHIAACIDRLVTAALHSERPSVDLLAEADAALDKS